MQCDRRVNLKIISFINRDRQIWIWWSWFESMWHVYVCVCVCAWTFIHVQVLRREWQRYVRTDTKGAYDMSRFRLNVHPLSLWKDCLVIFQVWYFLQGSWNHELANQPYYCRWWVILLLKRNLNCLTLTLFFHFPESFKTLQKFETPAIQWQMHQVDIRYWQPPVLGCQTFQTPQQLDDVWVVCDPPWTLKYLVFPSGWIWEENIKLPEDVTLRPDVLITLLASSPDWGVKNWKAGTQVLQSWISLPIVGSCII